VNTLSTLPRRRRTPQLLALVYLISLLLVGASLVALTTVVASGISSTAINASIAADRALVTAFVEVDMQPAEMMGAELAPSRQLELGRFVESLANTGLVRIKMYRPDGTIQLANDPDLVGTKVEIDDDLALAFTGVANGDIKDDPAAEPDLVELGIPVLLEEYLPVQTGGHVVAVFEVYRDASPILAQAADTRNQVLLVTLGAAGVLTLLLYFIFRSADARLKRQTLELMETTRRDALTGMLNHGAVVEELSLQLDEALPEERRLGLALVDIDNLRLLNDTHGHPAGDEVLRQVAATLRAELSNLTIVGRYGPDEFLCIAPPACVHDLVAAIERLRARLKELGPRFGGSERLPISVSVGVCYFPDHGRGTTELLSVAAVALSQAKMSGGDQVRTAEIIVNQDAQAERASFDVLQGLVIAVDTKDRYTKRHSEDVARYALFLADQLGLPPEWRRTLHIAGLLHDIGKIGIPDSILRKPAPLTADEYHIVKQHVALGHMIVRDLPHLDLVRAGIRFHHEQWDGGGYLEGIHGEEIPLVARILGVADAFSAMTTSRSYRKAMPLREALRRLEDSAGGQLDPSLVIPFVRGMETAGDAPIPGDSPRPIPTAWLPDAPPPLVRPDGAPLAPARRSEKVPSIVAAGMGTGHTGATGAANGNGNGNGNGSASGNGNGNGSGNGAHAKRYGRVDIQDASGDPPARIPEWLSTDAPWAGVSERKR
jgi:diguanylate cyclase (GGDEF)-like protein